MVFRKIWERVKQRSPDLNPMKLWGRLKDWSDRENDSLRIESLRNEMGHNAFNLRSLQQGRYFADQANHLAGNPYVHSNFIQSFLKGLGDADFLTRNEKRKLQEELSVGRQKGFHAEFGILLEDPLKLSAEKAFGLLNCIWSDPSLPLKTRDELYNEFITRPRDAFLGADPQRGPAAWARFTRELKIPEADVSHLPSLK
ncbi:MAG: hypothetical protein HY917_04850 [Candidatus Diapherotrites archaeon]|nr:hypothetical protein [Candidatus Diapherotrites archaeon]